MIPKINFYFSVLTFVFLSIFVSSCSEYEQVLKSKDVTYKADKAVEYFNAKKYEKSNELLKEAIQNLKTTPRFEDLYYKYALSFYYLKNYYDATIYLSGFASSFPNSIHAEESKYLMASCYDKLSSRSELDQNNTTRAIDEYQSFLLNYPNSPFKKDIENSLSQLKMRLEKKDVDAAELYYKIGQYKAAGVAYREVMKKYSNSVFADDYLLKSILSWKKYADLSVPTKRIERYQNALNEISDFKQLFKNNSNINTVENLQKQIETLINTIQNEQN